MLTYLKYFDYTFYYRNRLCNEYIVVLKGRRSYSPNAPTDKIAQKNKMQLLVPNIFIFKEIELTVELQTIAQVCHFLFLDGNK